MFVKKDFYTVFVNDKELCTMDNEKEARDKMKAIFKEKREKQDKTGIYEYMVVTIEKRNKTIWVS